jgi:hypothetical protein
MTANQFLSQVIVAVEFGLFDERCQRAHHLFIIFALLLLIFVFLLFFLPDFKARQLFVRVGLLHRDIDDQSLGLDLQSVSRAQKTQIHRAGVQALSCLCLMVYDIKIIELSYLVDYFAVREILIYFYFFVNQQDPLLFDPFFFFYLLWLLLVVSKAVTVKAYKI